MTDNASISKAKAKAKAESGIRQFIEERGADAVSSLLVKLYIEVEDMKIVIGTMIEDSETQKSLIKSQTRAAISMSETFVALKQRITELENKRRATVH